MLIAILTLSVLLGVAIAFIVALAVFNARSARERERASRDALDALRAQFSAIAAEELESRTRSLVQRNRDEVSALAGGLRDELLRSMSELRSATEQAVRTTSDIGAKMLAGVGGVRDSAERLGRKAEGLEQALAGGGKRQGIWGESVLARLFALSGLKENVNFWLQKGERGAGIPDSEVLDPAGRILVIDSKASLTAYLAACNATDDAEIARHLDEHVRSVKSHITELSAKDYIGRLRKANPDKTYIPQVAMFVPSEAAHAAAMARDPTLAQFAAERDVAIVTPLTLQAYLRIVAVAWQQDSIERNHAEIVAKAELLLRRVASSLAALEALGLSLRRAQEEYEKVMALVGRRDGAHSFVKPAQDLVALGIKMDKAKAKSLAAQPPDAAPQQETANA
ncbi:MAG: DNA recombination protein RmuC [Kiritimatiellae bacterium]|nr:DNA recombination protein RmuC [Kiritimatiellia bacterium]